VIVFATRSTSVNGPPGARMAANGLGSLACGTEPCRERAGIAVRSSEELGP
jgi:hypothetical protein